MIHSKWPKFFNIVREWRNFAKSDHTLVPTHLTTYVSPGLQTFVLSKVFFQHLLLLLRGRQLGPKSRSRGKGGNFFSQNSRKLFKNAKLSKIQNLFRSPIFNFSWRRQRLKEADSTELKNFCNFKFLWYFFARWWRVTCANIPLYHETVSLYIGLPSLLVYLAIGGKASNIETEVAKGKLKKCSTQSYLGNGCGSVNRAVASDTRGPWFESSHR